MYTYVHIYIHALPLFKCLNGPRPTFKDDIHQLCPLYFNRHMIRDILCFSVMFNNRLKGCRMEHEGRHLGTKRQETGRQVADKAIDSKNTWMISEVSAVSTRINKRFDKFWEEGHCFYTAAAGLDWMIESRCAD